MVKKKDFKKNINGKKLRTIVEFPMTVNQCKSIVNPPGSRLDPELFFITSFMLPTVELGGEKWFKPFAIQN
jgi:hypothetical protein